MRLDLEMMPNEILAAAQFCVNHNFQLNGRNAMLAEENHNLKQQIAEIRREAEKEVQKTFANEEEKRMAHRVDLAFCTMDPDDTFWYEDLSEAKSLFQKIYDGFFDTDVDDEEFVASINQFLSFLKGKKLVETARKIASKKAAK